MFEKVFTILDAEKIKIALEAISLKPGDEKDPYFEYGYRQGVYAGIDRAKKLIEQLFQDKNKQDFEL